MENKFKSIWNSSADRAARPSLSPCLFVFLLQEGSRACWLRRYLFCLLLQTSWRVLTADGPKWDKPKAAVCSSLLPNCLCSCQVICFIICYRGTRSYLVFWLSEKSFSSREESSVDVLHLCLWRCNLSCLEGVVSVWGMHIMEWSRHRLTAEGCVVFCETTSERNGTFNSRSFSSPRPCTWAVCWAERGGSIKPWQPS